MIRDPTGRGAGRHRGGPSMRGRVNPVIWRGLTLWSYTW
jgi:hypothetical protein